MALTDNIDIQNGHRSALLPLDSTEKSVEWTCKQTQLMRCI